ncbi:MAG: hypothetical protein ACK5X4_06140 [Phenylobacterium sp.]|jgi:hypothetical protein
MGGDKLTLLLFFVGTGIAGVMGALSTVGARQRILWGISVVCFVAALAYWRFATADSAALAFWTLWSLVPFVAVTMCLLVVGDREPRKPPPKPEKAKPTLNPALTADYFYGIAKGGTALEAKRKLAEFRNQLARMSGQVVNISESHDRIDVKLLSVSALQGSEPYNWITMYFRMDQADALSVVKPGDWIEFTGQVEHGGTEGWCLMNCEFVGRAEPPTPPRRRRIRVEKGS